jgi:hypothetical protein
MKGQEVIIRIARKVLRIIRAVMVSKRMYVCGTSVELISKNIHAPVLPLPKKKERPKK